jgi:hypothetical protein
MRLASAVAGIALAISAILPTSAFAWGGLGHRTVAAIAADLLPPAKVAKINQIMGQLEIDKNMIDGASYPDEYIRGHDSKHAFDAWHYADIPDANPQSFKCLTAKTDCLFDALSQNLAIVRQNKGDKQEAIALAWVIHLVGDMHQPLHMEATARGGNGINVTYRGSSTCLLYSGRSASIHLHQVWDDCLPDELAKGRTPQKLAADLLGATKTYQGRPELASKTSPPWLDWGSASHELAGSVAMKGASNGTDLQDAYIVGPGHALDTASKQLLTGGIRLAYLLDQAVQ